MPVNIVQPSAASGHETIPLPALLVEYSIRPALRPIPHSPAVVTFSTKC